MSGEVRLDAATLEQTAEEVAHYLATWEEALSGRERDGLVAACNDILRSLRRQATEARSRPPALSDWIRACEGTGLGEPLSWWDDGVEDDLDLAACWQSAGRRVVACLGPQGARYVEVDGKVYEWCSTPAELRAALEALAVSS